MARVAVFLACDDSRAMHGAIMVVDEGLHRRDLNKLSRG